MLAHTTNILVKSFRMSGEHFLLKLFCPSVRDSLLILIVSLKYADVSWLKEPAAQFTWLTVSFGPEKPFFFPTRTLPLIGKCVLNLHEAFHSTSVC